MKVRSFSLDCRFGEAQEIVANLRDMGLHVESNATGCDSYVQFVVSDEELTKGQLDEVFQYPPGGHDWSDCEWGDVQCKH